MRVCIEAFLYFLPSFVSEMIIILRRGQSFSLDFLMASVIFLAVFAAFYGFVTYLVLEPEDILLAREGQQVATLLTSETSPYSITTGTHINNTKLEKLSSWDYEELKAALHVQNEFCVYLEDNKGNLIPLSKQKKTFGKSVATITQQTNGKQTTFPCGEPYASS